MVSLIVIALSLTTGNEADPVRSHNTTEQSPNGSYVVHYSNAKSTKARPCYGDKLLFGRATPDPINKGPL